MNKKVLITGNAAGAWAARLAKPQYIPTFPITPQTEVIETLESWKANGKLPDSDIHQLESEHSVMSAAIAASATGSRTYTATSSQGLLLMHEMLYIASGERLPIVMNNISRGISAPITLWPDHNDFLGCRDTGWIMLHAKNNQEVLDFTLMAFKIAEHPNVLLPVMINMDGYTLSYTEEPVELPSQELVDNFLGIYKSNHNISPDNKLCIGAPVMAEYYSEFKIQQYKAMENARLVMKEVFVEFGELTGRFYGMIDYQPQKNSPYCLVTQGSMSTTTRYVCNKEKIATLNLPVIRPFPHKEIRAALSSHETIGVLDRNVMPGRGGIMIQEIKEVLYSRFSCPSIESYIVGLGGVPQTEEKIMAIIEKMIEVIYNLDDIDFTDAE